LWGPAEAVVALAGVDGIVRGDGVGQGVAGDAFLMQLDCSLVACV
jgi:hypothetical protein